MRATALEIRRIELRASANHSEQSSPNYQVLQSLTYTILFHRSIWVTCAGFRNASQLINIHILSFVATYLTPENLVERFFGGF
jgi:hypothetical protein